MLKNFIFLCEILGIILKKSIIFIFVFALNTLNLLLKNKNI